MKIHNSRKAASTALFNFRVDVFHRGISLASAVMERSDLRLLLDVTGHLQIATLESWIDVIVAGTERPQFTLEPKGSVIYYVTATPDPPTHGTRMVH